MATVITLPAPQTRKSAYRIGGFSLEPHRQLLKDGVPVQIGRKSLDILSVLAKAEGKVVTKDELMAAVWPNAIVEENAIQAQIVGLRKVLGPDADLLGTVRGLGYRLAVKVAAETRVAAAAPSAAVGPIAAPRRVTAASVVFALMVLTVVVAALAAFWHWRPQSQSAAAPIGGSVAIVPITARGGGAAARTLADELSDQITSVLSNAQVPVMLDPAGATQSSASARAGGPPAQADLLIGGSVRSDGNALAVIVDLTDARNREVLWSGEYRGDASAPAALEATVAAHVADVVIWGSIGRSGSVKLDAATLAAFIAGREATTGVRNGIGNVDVADYRTVVAAAPDFSWGHSALAAALAFQTLDAESASDGEKLRASARQEARRALMLDPHNGEAYLALGVILPPNDWLGREALFTRGAAADPGFEPVTLMEGRLLWSTGRGDEAIQWLERAHALNPLHGGATYTLILALAAKGRMKEARALQAQMRLQWPELGWTKRAAFWTPLIDGSIDEVVRVLSDPDETPADARDGVDDVLIEALRSAQGADRTRRDKAAKALIAGASASLICPEATTLVLAMMGRIDDAFGQVGACQPGSPAAVPILFLPSAAPLRADPRFMTIGRRDGLVAYWRKTGHWPDFCGEPGLRYDCRTEAAKIGA